MKKHTYLHSRSTWIALALGLFILVTLVTGCENSNIFSDMAEKNSREARTEAALMAMDDSNYRTAISILEDPVAEFPDDSLLWQYLSNAHSGAAGLDTNDLSDDFDLFEADIDQDNDDNIDTEDLQNYVGAL